MECYNGKMIKLPRRDRKAYLKYKEEKIKLF